MSDAYTSGTPRSTPLALKVVSVPLVVAAVAFGVWFAGAVVSDDMEIAMVATTIWFGIAGLACLLVVRARRDMLLPVLGTYAVAAVAIGGWLAYESLVDDEVNESVVQPSAANQLVSAGSFVADAHATSGSARIIQLPDGTQNLTMTDFETDPGPDLRVYLANDPGADGDTVDLGGLKGNVGNQQYELPSDVNAEDWRYVVIWCRAFTVAFGSAELKAS